MWSCDLGHGVHPVVIVSHPLRAANKPVVEVLDCSSQRAGRNPDKNEVLLDATDGMNWETLCKCDCIYAVEKSELSDYHGQVSVERRRAIVQSIIKAHDWERI